MKTVIVIPARFASTRLPGKPLLEIAGEAMVVRVWRRCSEVRGVERVIVATDDERVRLAVTEAGGEAMMTSPDHRSGTDRVAEAVGSVDCDLVVNVQGDEPFLEPRAVEELLDCFERGGEAPVATLATEIDKRSELFDPAVVKVLVGTEGRAVYFSRFPIPFRPELWKIEGQRWTGGAGEDLSGLPCPYYRHLGIYAFRRDYLRTFTGLEPTPGELAERLEQLRILESGTGVQVVVTTYGGLAVDTPGDLERARREAAVKA